MFVGVSKSLELYVSCYDEIRFVGFVLEIGLQVGLEIVLKLFSPTVTDLIE